MRYLAVLIVVLLAITVTGCGVDDPAYLQDTESDAMQDYELSTEDYDDASESEPVEEPEPAAGWHQAIKFSTSNDAKSKTFKVSGEKQKLICNVKGDPDFAIAGVFIFPKGEDVMYEHDMTFMDLGTSDSMMYLEPGSYYLDCLAANCTLTVTVKDWR